MTKRRRPRKQQPPAIMRPLPPDDPRNPDHPVNKPAWLKLAGTIGTALAERDIAQAARQVAPRGPAATLGQPRTARRLGGPVATGTKRETPPETPPETPRQRRQTRTDVDKRD